MVQPFEPDLILCPRCGKPLRRVTAGEGSFVVTCDNKRLVQETVAGGGTRLVAKPCGQAVHVTATGGVAFALPISSALAQQYRQEPQPARAVYRAAGAFDRGTEPHGG